MLILAFDTATADATCALVADGELLAERRTAAKVLLQDVDALLRQARARPADLDALAVGTGPGSFTATRIGLAAARGLALGLDLPAAGVSTLDALAAGVPGAEPVLDARRGEVFAAGPRALRPDELELEPGTVCVGDGARRYRSVLAAAGADVPPDDSDLHVPWARHHAALAVGYGPAQLLQPVYVRAPDADSAVGAAGGRA